MPVPIFTVDAFAERPFTGNPAGVCLLDSPADETFMRAVAREMNLSETAFLHPEGDGWRLRWFTPTVEVALCGHATLASAHVLWSEGVLRADATARFATRSGLLTATRREGMIVLDFPARPATPAAPPAGLLEALGVAAVTVGRSIDDFLVEVEDEAAVRSVAPDFARLATVEARGVIVTAAAAAPDHDFVSRFFAPRVGVPEDPVTGSAHCCLAPFWRDRLGREAMRGYQASARGGVVEVRVAGDHVELGGRAVTILRGELMV